MTDTTLLVGITANNDVTLVSLGAEGYPMTTLTFDVQTARFLRDQLSLAMAELRARSE